jgi:transketolase
VISETLKTNLEIFSETLIELAQKDKDIIVVTSDSRGSGKLVPFAEQHPEQIVEVGIAEQNLVGIAAGLASCGKKVFAVSPASFLTTRALEQIKNDVCYSDNPVTLVGISAGVSYGALGSTHHSLHDLAALRAIHNLDIVVPADNFETRECIKAAVHHPKPLYIRFGKKVMPHISNGQTFHIGQCSKITHGQDVLFLATGETVHPAFCAAERLKNHNISTQLLSVHSISPLDSEAILNSAQHCKIIITVEEHMVNGGFGEAVASLLLQHAVSRPFKIIGIPNEDTVTGSQEDIFNHYGLSAAGLEKTALELLQTSMSQTRK